MAASAQSSVQVQLPAGDFAVFASPGPALAPPPDPILSKGGAASVPLQPKLDHLYVWDRATGGLAVKTIDPKTPIWAVSPSNFTRIESVTVAAEHNGQPLSAGEVSLGDGDSRHSSVIDASAPATFFDVPQGKLNVTVKYRKKDGTSGDVTQVFQAAPKVGGLKLTVGVTDDVDTATAVPGAVGTAAPAGPVPVVAPPVKVQTANPLGSAVVLLIGIGAAAFIVYNLMRFMRGNPGTVGAKLQQLGGADPSARRRGAQPGDSSCSRRPLNPSAGPKDRASRFGSRSLRPIGSRRNNRPTLSDGRVRRDDPLVRWRNLSWPRPRTGPEPERGDHGQPQACQPAEDGQRGHGFGPGKQQRDLCKRGEASVARGASPRRHGCSLGRRSFGM